ncbi:hypothetical protein [Paenibacillus sp. FSL E2-0178]|uniref:hypothetical protein n=1 Tax=Paenibacillus sp. FSL E2-0178 TaxID=2921361 RepID=UPI00315869EF
MKWVNNLNELAKQISSPTGKQMVFGQENIRKALREATSLFEKILKEEVQAYYDSYKPVNYERTYGMRDSLRVSPITMVGNELQISIYFDRAQSTHPSIFGGEPGYPAGLINDGWAWGSQSVNIYRLSRYEGFHFVEKAMARFESQNRWGFRVRRTG